MKRGEPIPEETRLALWARSGGRCEIQLAGCWRKAADPHHRKSRARGGSNDLINLLAVCPHCHRAVTDHAQGTWRYRTHSWDPEGTDEERNVWQPASRPPWTPI